MLSSIIILTFFYELVAIGFVLNPSIEVKQTYFTQKDSLLIKEKKAL